MTPKQQKTPLATPFEIRFNLDDYNSDVVSDYRMALSGGTNAKA
jgi:hypothetical protein